jgi:hypothetical protein
MKNGMLLISLTLNPELAIMHDQNRLTRTQECMKKTWLTLGAVLGISVGAFAQAQLLIDTPPIAGFNTVSSNPNDSGANGTYSDFPTGTINLEIFTIPSAGNASLASTIDALAANASTEPLAILDLFADGFIQQNFGPEASGVAGEAPSQNLMIDSGFFTSSSQGIYAVGTSLTLNPGTDIYYALLATMIIDGEPYQGALVLDAPGFEGATGYLPGTSTSPNVMPADWGNNQNLLLATVPEPAILALAGLGGISMLFLTKR